MDNDSARVGPGDPRFGTLTRGFNQRWIADPSYVQLCSSPRDVVEGVDAAVAAGLRTTLRGGGHCYENFVYGNDRGVILDLTPMNGVYRDSKTGWYVIEAGATLFDAYTQLYRQHGVTIPGGSCYSVGAAGHISGGGYGLLSRKHGLTIDHLTAIEVVHVDAGGKAHLDLFDDREDPDSLLWGYSGGGGGNFGVITRYFFADPPAAPSNAWLLSLAWNWSDFTPDSFRTFLQSYGGYFVERKDPGDPSGGLFALLHLTCAPQTQITLTVQLVEDDPAPLEGFVAAVRPTGLDIHPARHPVGYVGVPPPSLDAQLMPWLFVTQTLDGTGPPQRGKYKSAYMIGNFTDHECAVVWESLRESGFSNRQSLLQVDSYGCQVNAVAPGATAIPQRSSAMKLQYQTYWQGQDGDQRNLDWIRKFYDQMYGPAGPVPDGRLDGCYVNYPDVDLRDWQYLYYKENYPRLQRVKQAWDPLNVFNHAQSVELPKDSEPQPAGSAS
jgi:FAD/FMN-containing dehydrogenase